MTYTYLGDVVDRNVANISSSVQYLAHYTVFDHSNCYLTESSSLLSTSSLDTSRYTVSFDDDIHYRILQLIFRKPKQVKMYDDWSLIDSFTQDFRVYFLIAFWRGNKSFGCLLRQGSVIVYLYTDEYL